MTEEIVIEEILVVGDEATGRLLAPILEGAGYLCHTARSAEEAAQRLAERSFDLIVVDVDLPGDKGLVLLERVAKSHPDAAAVICTGVIGTELSERALAAGAYAYLIKPLEPNQILINVTSALRRRRLEIENRGHRALLEQMVKERTAELSNVITELEHTQRDLRVSREDAINRFAIAAEFGDDQTVLHIARMSRYCGLIARLSGSDHERCELIRLASVLHDVGKVGVPDEIVLKTGPLDPDEMKIMQSHCEIGHKILSGSNWEPLQTASVIALTHHERLDGTGYPNGLSGDHIPVEGRIAAIADVFDSLISDRAYRKAFPLPQALDIMQAGRGSHFDPALFDLFFDAIDDVLEIRTDTDQLV